MMTKKVLIVIVNFNSSEYGGDCFYSLKKINYPSDSYKILIIDNASTDNSLEFIRQNFSQFEIIRNNKNLGFASANNQGCSYALANNFDYIYLLNQDTVVTPNFLQVAVSVAESNQVIGAVQSKLLLPDGRINSLGNDLHYLGFGFCRDYKQADHRASAQTVEINFASAAGALYRLSALKQVGLFDQDFFLYHEDSDLSWRLKLAGYSVILALNSVVIHKYKFSHSVNAAYYLERNRYISLIKNYSGHTLLLILPAFIIWELGSLIYSFLSGKIFFRLKIYKYFINFSNWKKIITKRNSVQLLRRQPDRRVVKAFSGEIKFQENFNPLVDYLFNPLLNWYWQAVKFFI